MRQGLISEEANGLQMQTKDTRDMGIVPLVEGYCLTAPLGFKESTDSIDKRK